MRWTDKIKKLKYKWKLKLLKEACIEICDFMIIMVVVVGSVRLSD